MNTETTKTNIKNIYRSYSETYKAISDSSWRRKIMDLSPGEPTPQKGVLYYADDAENFRFEAVDLRQKGLAEVQTALDRIAEVKAEAPSSEAVNYITMLRDKKNITDHDIDIALKHYGHNYSAHNAIMDIAEDRKIYGFTRGTELDAIEKRFSEIHDNLSRMGTDAYTAQKQSGGGYTAMMELLIDEIPDTTI